VSQLKTTHRKVIAMNNVLRTLREESTLGNVRLSYAIAKNIRYMEADINTIKEIGKPDDEYMKFENARLKLNNECAQKDSRKQPRIIDNRFVIDPEKQVIFDDGMTALQAEHKAAIEAHDHKQKDLEKMLDDECSIDTYPIKLSWLPPSFKPGDIEILLELFEDDLAPN
jgi:hypothetical protein